MPEGSEAEQAAIKAVAKHFSAQEQKGASGVWLTMGGRQISLDVVILPEQHAVRKSLAQARLREDVVARRVLGEIESTLRPQVPDGKILVLTLGAPIKVPKLLIASLTDTLLTSLKSGVEEIDEKRTILGNRVRFRLVNADFKGEAAVLGFVFSGDLGPGLLVQALRGLHGEIAAKAQARLPKEGADEHWLVLGNGYSTAEIKTWRSLARVCTPFGYEKILMVLKGGRIETLAESLFITS